MHIYQHRVNTIEQLKSTPTKLGVEIDIRSHGELLVLSHDPFMRDLVIFEDWLADYRHNGIILNVKEEGLEERILRLLNSHSIDDFFFLDQSFPFLVRTLKQEEFRCAVRVSDFESVETARNLIPKPNWVWIDSFEGDWKHLAEIGELVSLGYKTCFVSPELQGRNLESEFNQILNLLNTVGFEFDAVCTKMPEVWQVWP